MVDIGRMHMHMHMSILPSYKPLGEEKAYSFLWLGQRKLADSEKGEGRAPSPHVCSTCCLLLARPTHSFLLLLSACLSSRCFFLLVFDEQARMRVDRATPFL